MSEPDPRKHHDFVSHGSMLKLKIPFIIDEHEMTGITVFTLKSNSNFNSWYNIQISTSGPIVLKQTGREREEKQIKKKIKVPGNDSFHIQSPKRYSYPSGKEGECVAQANILLRKLDKINNEEIPSDSLSIDLYIRRKLVNAFKAVWKSADGFITNLGGSVIITALITIITYFLGKDIGSLVPHFVATFIIVTLLFSVLYSRYTRDRLIKKRLESNFMYQKLLRGGMSG